MLVENMSSSKGNKVPNQFIINIRLHVEEVENEELYMIIEKG